MFKSIYNQMDKSGDFFLKNDIFIQKQETIFFYIAKLLPKKYSYIFYKIFLVKYNAIIEKLEFGIRQHSLLEK